MLFLEMSILRKEWQASNQGMEIREKRETSMSSDVEPLAILNTHRNSDSIPCFWTWKGGFFLIEKSTFKSTIFVQHLIHSGRNGRVWSSESQSDFSDTNVEVIRGKNPPVQLLNASESINKLVRQHIDLGSSVNKFLCNHNSFNPSNLLTNLCTVVKLFVSNAKCINSVSYTHLTLPTKRIV